MSRRHRRLASLAAALAMLTGTATAAEMRIRNLDLGTEQGLSDPRPATPVGGNPGKTRGEQARVVFEHAASLWGAVLKSPVPIEVKATFGGLHCTSNGGTLGQAYALEKFLLVRDPSNPSTGVWHHAALANALVGYDLNPHEADIHMEFNGDIGTVGCLQGFQWYFGLDGNTPEGSQNLLETALHELAHGLGFSGFGNPATGKALAGTDKVPRPDIYSMYVYDNASGKRWYEMSDAERVSSALNDGHLVFTGPHVKAHAPLALGARDALQVTRAGAGTREYTFARARFGPVAGPANFSGTPVRAVTGDTAEACTALDNAAAVAGHIAIVDAGDCTFQTQARFAEAAGAIGMLVVNRRDGDVFPLWPDGGSAVAIPVVAISRGDGEALKQNLAGSRIAMRSVPAGIDADGNVQLYAPRQLASGSSFSHFDLRLSPDALMEPNISAQPKGHIDLDLTPSLLMDEGWGVNDGGQRLGTCDSGVPTWLPGGIIVGANIVATAKTLASTSAAVGDYAASLRSYAARLATDGFLSETQASSLDACLSDAELARQYASWRQGGLGDPVLIELANGQTFSRQAGAAGSERTYTLVVPDGARTLNIRTFGGTGDASLLVKLGGEPTLSSYHYRSVHPGNSESVIKVRPTAGTYFIKVVGAGAYAGLSVQASYRK